MSNRLGPNLQSSALELAKLTGDHSLLDLKDTLDKVRWKQKQKARLMTISILLAGFLATCLLSANFTAFGEASHSGPTIRERCRQEIAGHFLKAHDHAQQADLMLTHLAQRTNAIKKEKINVKKEIQEINTYLATDIFDVTKLRHLKHLKGKMAMIIGTLKEYEQLKKSYQKQHQNALTQKTNIQKAISPIFKIEKLSGKGHGYRIHLNYREKCPPYRHNCPLLPNTAKQLKSLKMGTIALPTSCKHYATFLQVQP